MKATKKMFLFFLSCVFIFQLSAQEFYGNVKYDYFMDPEQVVEVLATMQANKPELWKSYGPMMKRTLEYRQQMKWELKLDGAKSVSLFSRIEGTQEQEQDPVYQNAVISTGGSHTHFLDRGNEKRVYQTSISGGTFVNVTQQYVRIKWTLLPEQKRIGNYDCKLARGTYEDKKGKEYQVAAWYAPSLPLPFGPADFDGLPGLILELREGGKLAIGYRMTSISLTSTPGKKEVQLPPADATMTEREIDDFFAAKRESVMRN